MISAVPVLVDAEGQYIFAPREEESIVEVAAADLLDWLAGVEEGRRAESIGRPG